MDYYTADLHLGHYKVAHHRGFATVEEHDETVLKGIREVAKPGVNIWVLGDISSGRDTGTDTALTLLNDIRLDTWCTFHLIAGNHDKVHPMHRGYQKHRPFWDAFQTIDSMGTFRHRKEKVLLSHFPYEGDRGITRYPEYRLKDSGLPIIHGHTHSTEKASRSEAGTPQVCVGLDAWDMKPASKEELTKIIDMEEA